MMEQKRLFSLQFFNPFREGLRATKSRHVCLTLVFATLTCVSCTKPFVDKILCGNSRCLFGFVSRKNIILIYSTSIITSCESTKDSIFFLTTMTYQKSGLNLSFSHYKGSNAFSFLCKRKMSCTTYKREQLYVSKKSNKIL